MNGSWPDRQRRRIGIVFLTSCRLVAGVDAEPRAARAPGAASPCGGETGGAEPVRPRVATARSAGARRRTGTGLQCTIVRRVSFPGGRGRGRRSEGDVLAFEALPPPGRRVIGPGWSISSPSRSGSPSGAGASTPFPTVPNGLEIKGVCFSERHDFNPVRTQSLNSIALFGAAGSTTLSAKAITHRRMPAGGGNRQGAGGKLPGYSCGPAPDLARRPGREFGWRRSSPRSRNSSPPPAPTRSDWAPPAWTRPSRWPVGMGTGPAAIGPDLDQTQFRCAGGLRGHSAAPPGSWLPPASPRMPSSVEQGKSVFTGIGCAACHTPDLGGVTGVYSDFLLHRIVDSREELHRDP